MTVEIRINLDADQAEQALQQLQQQSGESFGKVEQDGQKAASGLSTAFDRAAVVLSAITSVIAGVATGIGALTQQVTAGVVDTANYASVLGISAQELGVFELAARRAGGDVDGLREGIRTAQEGIGEFINKGSGPAAEAFQVLGISLQDAQGRTRSIAQVFPELVAGLAQVGDRATRTTLEIQLFGEEDSRVAALLAQNPKAFQEAAEAAQRYGTTLGGDLVQQSRQFQTGLVDLQSAVGGLGQTIVSALLPTLNEVIPDITAWVAELRNSETLHNTFIPLLQDFVSALGQVDVVVAALQDGWNALVAVLNISLGVLVKVGAALIDLALTPLQKIIDAAALAADVLGFDGVAEKLRNVSSGIDSLTQGADALGSHILETGTTAVASIGKIADALSTTGEQATATAAATVTGNIQATGSIERTTAALNALEQQGKATAASTQQQQQAVNAVNQAYQNLQAQSTTALQTLATRALANFEQIRKSGMESADGLQRIFADQVLPKITSAYQTFSQRIAAINKGIADDGVRRIQTLQAAYEQLGLDAPEALRRLARDAVAAFELIVRDGNRNLQDLRKIYDDTVVKPFQEAFGKLPPAADKAIAIIRSSTRTALEGIQQDTQRSYEMVNGVYTNSATVGKEQIASVGQQTSAVLQSVQQQTAAAYAAVNQTYEQSRDAGISAAQRIQEQQEDINDALPEATRRAYEIVNGVYTNSARVGSEAAQGYGDTFSKVQSASVQVAQQASQSIGASFEAYTAIAQKSLKGAADAAVREFQRSFDSGRFTTQGLARLWEEELVPRILDAYGTIPPHLAGLNERLVANARQSADAIAAAHYSAAQRSTSFFDAATGKIIERVTQGVQSVTAIFAKGLQSISVLQPFGNTVEELTEQIGKVSEEIDSVRNSIGRGIPTDFITFQVERLQEVLFELIKRRDELLDQGQGSEDLRRLLGVPPADTGESTRGGQTITTGIGGQASSGSFSGGSLVAQQIGQAILDATSTIIGGLTPAPFSSTVTAGPDNPFLPPSQPPARGGSSGGSGFDGSALTPNLDPLGLGAGRSTQARSGSAVTFAAGSIVVNTQARDANALAAELVPALNQQIRLGALRT